MMFSIYPHRKVGHAPTIHADAHGGAVTGDWLDHNCLKGGPCFLVSVAPGAAGPINFTFETASGTPGDLDTPDASTVEQMGNCEICSETMDFSDGTLTVDPAEAPYATDGYVECVICVCCPKKFVRAVSDAGGNYSVKQIGMPKMIDRI